MFSNDNVKWNLFLIFPKKSHWFIVIMFVLLLKTWVRKMWLFDMEAIDRFVEKKFEKSSFASLQPICLCACHSLLGMFIVPTNNLLMKDFKLAEEIKTDVSFLCRAYNFLWTTLFRCNGDIFSNVSVAPLRFMKYTVGTFCQSVSVFSYLLFVFLILFISMLDLGFSWWVFNFIFNKDGDPSSSLLYVSSQGIHFSRVPLCVRSFIIRKIIFLKSFRDRFVHCCISVKKMCRHRLNFQWLSH